MRKITQEFFCKQHNSLMKNSSYKKGYEHAKPMAIWSALPMDMLVDLAKVYAHMGFDGDIAASGIAYALREIIWGRIQEEKAIA